MTEFTPGPWSFRRDENDTHTVHVDGQGWDGFCSIIVRVDDEVFDDKTCVANANLIVTAPELYEALSDLVTSIELGEDINLKLTKARYTLEAARGE